MVSEARKEAERRLAGFERQRVSNLVANVPGVVWEAWGKPDEATQRIDFVSDYVERMLGYSVEEWLSTPNFWLTIVHPDDRERAAAEAAAIYAGCEGGVSQFRWIAKDGRAVWVEAQSTVICDESGEPIGMRGVTMDISERKLAEQRQHFLSEASAILSSSLDYLATLKNVARLAVGSLADLCSVDIVESGSIQRVALAHADPAREELFSEMEPRFRPDPRLGHPVMRVVKTGQSELYGELSDELLRTAARDEQHLERLRALDVKSLMIVPLVAGGTALGTITFVSAESNRRYGQPDLEFAQEIARRAGLAIDNARRYEAEQAARRQAEEAAGRTARLQAVTAALSEALAPGQVGDVVIEAAMAGLRARSGIIALLSEDGSAFEAVSSKAISEDFARAWDDFAASPPPAVVEAVRRGQPVFVQSKAELLEAFPDLARLSVAENRSFACLPLMVESRAVGAMVLTFAAFDAPNQEDRGFVLALAGQCAQALERARLYEAEQSARRAAEFAALRTARLQAVTAALSKALTPSEVADVVLAQGLNALEAAAGAIALLANGGSELEFVARSGYPKALVRKRQRLPADVRMPLADAIRSGDLILLASLEERLRLYPHLAPLHRLTGDGAAAGIPLAIEGRVLGGMVLNFKAPRNFSEEDRQFMLALGRLCAQALERARLYEAEQAARAEAEAAELQQTFLAEASAILASSLDYETTLASVAKLCVPYLGDWCAIDILEGERSLHRVAVVHMDPAKVELARQFQEKYPPNLDEDGSISGVLRYGKSLFYREVADDMLVQNARDPEHLEILRGLGLKSVISVPLLARGRTLGVITLVMAESGRHYEEADLELAEDLARRAGLAVDNARLYTESQRIQEELRKANEAKDEFLGLVSHELRTPITTVYGGTRLLRTQGEKLDQESKESVLSDIEQESERLHRIVEDLLVLARVELGQEVVTEPVLVQRVIEKTVAVLTKRQPRRRIEVQIEKDLQPIAASAVYLEQVVRNLLSNADKYSPDDMPIEISARSNGSNEVQISVLDHGPGIPPEEIDLVFERFYRSDRTSGHAGGAGIGLTVCKRLIEAQNGRIWARTHEDGGLEVTFALPAYDERS